MRNQILFVTILIILRISVQHQNSKKTSSVCESFTWNGSRVAYRADLRRDS